MTRGPRRPITENYPVGYGKPPRHTRFRPGVSGNPKGRPRGACAGRADRLALKEIYRRITVREGDVTLTLPTVQAIMRQLGRLALKGNRPALRAYVGIAQATEQRLAFQEAAERENEPQIRMSNITEEARLEAFMAFIKRTKPRNKADGGRGSP
jgi:hypothetical protein